MWLSSRSSKVYISLETTSVSGNRPAKSSVVSKAGRADFAEAEGGEDPARGFLHAVPQRGLRRQEIAGAPDGLKLPRLLFFLAVPSLTPYSPRKQGGR